MVRWSLILKAVDSQHGSQVTTSRASVEMTRGRAESIQLSERIYSFGIYAEHLYPHLHLTQKNSPWWSNLVGERGESKDRRLEESSEPPGRPASTPR